MSTPIMTPPPDAPNRLQGSVFRARMDAFLAWWVNSAYPELVAALAWITARAAEVQGNATTALGAANAATAASSTATAQAAAAATSASTAANAPGTGGTSTTSNTIGLGSKTWTTQTGKLWSVGQTVSIAVTASPTVRIVGPITAYNSGTGALTVNVEQVFGSGTFAAWTIAIGASYSELPSRTGNARRVPVVTGGEGIEFSFLEDIKTRPIEYASISGNMLVRSDTVDTNNAEWSLVGSMTRVGTGIGPRGVANTATIYQSGAGSSAVAQSVTIATAGWYTLSFAMRLHSGSIPAAGFAAAIDRDIDLVPGSVERATLPWPALLTTRWRRHELTFYATPGAAALYLLTDSLNGAQIALADAKLNAGIGSSIYSTTTTTPGVSTPVASPAIFMTNTDMASGWVTSGSGGGTVSFLPSGFELTPDGRVAREMLATNAVSGSYRVARQSAVLASGNVYVYVALFKAGPALRYGYILGTNPSGTSAIFDLLTGQVTAMTACIDAWAEFQGNGWWLCFAVFNPATSAALTTGYAGMTSSPTTQTMTPVVGQGIFCGGFTIRQGYDPGAPVFVTGTPAALGHVSMRPRTEYHVDTTGGMVTLTLPLANEGDWVRVVDIGRQAGITPIRVLRGTGQVIQGLAEDLDINMSGAAVVLRATIDNGWIIT